MCRTVRTNKMGFVKRINSQSHLQCGRAKRVSRNKMRRWEYTETERLLTAVLNYLREANTQEVSLKQQSMNIMLKHSPLKHGAKWGIKGPFLELLTSLGLNTFRNFYELRNTSGGETISHFWIFQSKGISRAQSMIQHRLSVSLYRVHFNTWGLWEWTGDRS